MHLYRQSIVIFGLILPLVVTIAVIVGLFMAKATVARSFDEKISHYQGFEQNKKTALQLEADNSRKREHIEHWETLLTEETASTVTSNLRLIEERLPSKEFQKTAQSHPPGKKAFGAASAQKSSQIDLAFRATYRSMQKALLELESRMPQLQLQDLRIESSGQTNNLSFQVSYTAWEK